MASDSQLKIDILVDASQINGVLTPATKVANDAFTDLAAAQIRVKTASYELNSTLNTLAKSGLAPTAEMTAEVAAAMFEAESAAHAFAAAEESAYGSTERLTVGANNARAAFAGLNRELGLGGNRALSTFIAQSETLGPILSQAFTGIAIAGFIQLAVTAAEKLSKWTAELFIFSKAEQDVAAQLAKDNAAIGVAYTAHLAALREISLVGLSREAADALRLKYAQEDQAYAKTAVDDLTRKVALETQKLNIMQDQADQQKKSFSYTGPGAAPQLDLGPGVTKQQALVNSLNSSLGELQATLRSTGDTVQAMNKKFNVAALGDERKELENLVREREKEGKEAEEAAVRRGNAERQTAENKERFDEEIAASGESSAKRDLEQWRTALTEKTRLIEAQGKAQLDQIARASGLAETQTKNHSLLGGADPAIAKEAFAAYQRQVAIVDEEIAAEDQLQQALKATGAAQDDPKVEESMRRQASLVGQMNRAWDEYQKKVQQVSVAQESMIKQSLSGVFSSINSNFVQILNGQETLGRGIQKIWTSVVDDILVDFLKLGEKWVMQHVIMAAASKLFHLQDASSAVAASTAGIAAAKALGLAQVGLAGAGGVASMAAAPFPIDTTAPEFGASMAASAAGLLAFASGGVVPGTGPVPAIVHGGEWILNESQQRALGSGGDAGDTHLHYSPTINGGGGSIDDTLRAHGKALLRQAKRELRRRQP